MSEKNIYAALIKAQAEMKHPKMSGKNPHFKSKFAPLSEVVDACKPVLNKHGLALFQPTKECDSGITVHTMLVHESGATLELGDFHIPVDRADPQKYVAALTYARRASLSSALGLVGEEDMDGESLPIRPVTPKPKTKPATPGQFHLLDKFAKAKEMLGEDLYYMTLGGLGYEKANEIPVAERQAVLDELRAVHAQLEAQKEKK